MYFGDHSFNSHWGIHLEAQFRRYQMGLNPQQLLLRTGINYHLNQMIFVTAGYCFVETYPYGAFPVKTAYPEHRIWEQLQLKTQFGRLEWLNRFRLEQRFSKLPILSSTTSIYEPGTAIYTNRFRLMNRISISNT